MLRANGFLMVAKLSILHHLAENASTIGLLMLRRPWLLLLVNARFAQLGLEFQIAMG
jgi:hypothetical protein